MRVWTAARYLSSKDHNKLLVQICPNCLAIDQLLPGPRGGLARNVLCAACRMEFNVGPACAQVIAERCPEERARDVYDLDVQAAGVVP